MSRRLIDGGLRGLFRKSLPTAQWTSVETGATMLGVPNSEFCFPKGRQGWIEMKATSARAVRMRPEQVAWIDRRSRLGGTVFIAVRRKRDAGPRRTAADELWLVPGGSVQALQDAGLDLERIDAWIWEGGPGQWSWPDIGAVLMHGP